MSGKFLLDLPETEDNDVIGFDVYVDDVVDAIKSEARMIGLLANYGSGKSSVINMVKERINKEQENLNKEQEHVDKNEEEIEKIEFININLWKISEKKKSKSANDYDETVYIHKFLLRKLISYLPETSNKSYFENKINGNYSLFNISLKNDVDIFWLYLFFCIFLFNIIMKIEVVDFSIPRICIFILDLLAVLGVVCILSKAKLYLSFSKDSTNRIINEGDTCECFKEVIRELVKDNKKKKIIICIEDLDRYNDANFVIKILEQIYKFYVEYDRDLNVKFLISLKQPYLLVKDHIKNLEQFTGNQKKLVEKDKELYEKLFDLIINLQTVSIQSFSSVVLGMISKKELDLKNMGINIPKDDDSIGAWSYLYYGKNVSLRDIKHRFNYFIILYENLWRHKMSLDNADLFEINLTTCLFVSFLEDAFSSEFYELVNSPEDFKNMVSEYLFTRKFLEPSKNDEFNSHIKEALKLGIIKSDYIMYFYKYPKKREIKNIFDSSIQNAIFTNSKFGISDFDWYCKNASKEVIFDSLKERDEFHGIPSIIFENKVLYNVAKKEFPKSVLKLLENDYVFSSENGVKNIQRILPKLYLLKDEKLIDDYMLSLYNDLKINFDDEKIIVFRKEVIKTIGLNADMLVLYGNDMPLITYEEALSLKDGSYVFEFISENKIDVSVMDIISLIIRKGEIKFSYLVDFFDKIKNIDSGLFKEIFYSFDYSKYSKLQKYRLFSKNYKNLDLDNVEEIERFVSTMLVLPLQFEKEIIQMMYCSDDSERIKFEEMYVEIIMNINNISSVTKNAILNFRYNYIYNETFEELLYDKELYNEYVYSRIRRTNEMSCEMSKFDSLKIYYLNYFMSDNLFDTEVYIDKDISNYIKKNVSYENLDFRRIELLYEASQTLNDLKVVIENRYMAPQSDLNWKKYLRGIKSIAEGQELDFINYLIHKVKNEKFRLTLVSYNCIKKLLNYNNVRKWQKIKHLCIKE